MPYLPLRNTDDAIGAVRKFARKNCKGRKRLTLIESEVFQNSIVRKLIVRMTEPPEALRNISHLLLSKSESMQPAYEQTLASTCNHFKYFFTFANTPYICEP